LGITMLQKLVLANLVASLLLAMNVAFADTALLVADGVLVEKSPEILLLLVPEVPGEEVAVPVEPVVMGAAVNASYVSSDGWAVTGTEFIDAAVAVFDFNTNTNTNTTTTTTTTTSVSQATLTLPIEQVFTQNGVAPIEIYVF
jgi:hypothetical protein